MRPCHARSFHITAFLLSRAPALGSTTARIATATQVAERGKAKRRLESVSKRFTLQVRPARVSFFLRGVAEQAADAIKRSEKLLGLWHQYRKRVQAVGSSALPLILVDELFTRPYVTFSSAAKVLGVTFRSAQLNVRKLVAAKIVEELPGRTYGRIFMAREVLNVLEATSIQ